MNSVALHRPHTCLTDDDFEGLHYLYPTCFDATVRSERTGCVEYVSTVGFLRLLVAVFVPFGSIMAIVLGLLLSVRRGQRLRTDRLREERWAGVQRTRWLRASLSAVAKRPTGPSLSVAQKLKTLSTRRGDRGSLGSHGSPQEQANRANRATRATRTITRANGLAVGTHGAHWANRVRDHRTSHKFCELAPQAPSQARLALSLIHI